MSKKIKYSIENALFSGVLFFCRVLPELWVVKFGQLLGRLFYYIGMRKSVVLKNLEIAFGEEKTAEERDAICKKVYENLGITMFEVLLLDRIPKEQFHNYFEIHGIDELKEAMKEGKGAVIAAGHFCNWEWMPTGLSATYQPVYGYTGRHSNKTFQQKMDGMRQKFGVKTIAKSKQAFPLMTKVLSENSIVGLIGDLNVPGSDLFVDFFGKKAATGAGMAFLPLQSKAPIFFSWGVRVAPLRHKITLYRLDCKPSGDLRTDVENLTALILSELEKVVRLYPEHYWWVHKRWKSRPPEEEGVNLYH